LRRITDDNRSLAIITMDAAATGGYTSCTVIPLRNVKDKP
jgi:hypothetical protein